MLYQIWARLPVTMVTKTASIIVDRHPKHSNRLITL
jgi:hypothetical protein